MESGSTSLNVQAVSGYKFSYTQKGENYTDYTDGYQSSYVASGTVIESNNQDQDDSAKSSAFDLPTGGYGYYLLAHNDICKSDLGGTGELDKYSASLKAELRSSGTDLAWFPAVSLSEGAQFKVRQHTFSSSETVDRFLDITDDWAWEDYKGYASIGDGVCTINASGVYDIYLKNADGGYQLYIAQFDKGSSGSGLKEQEIPSDTEIAKATIDRADSSATKLKMPGQGPKRAIDTNIYRINVFADSSNWTQDNVSMVIQYDGNGLRQMGRDTDFTASGSNSNWSSITIGGTSYLWCTITVSSSQRAGITHDNPLLERGWTDNHYDGFYPSYNIKTDFKNNCDSNTIKLTGTWKNFAGVKFGWYIKVRLYTGLNLESSEYKLQNARETPAAPSAPKGYKFDGWYLDSDFETPWEEETYWTDQNLYAKYSPAYYLDGSSDFLKSRDIGGSSCTWSGWTGFHDEVQSLLPDNSDNKAVMKGVYLKSGAEFKARKRSNDDYLTTESPGTGAELNGTNVKINTSGFYDIYINGSEQLYVGPSTTYTITLDKNYTGAAGNYGTIKAANGHLLQPPADAGISAPSRTGYTFGGFWNTAACDETQYLDASLNPITVWTGSSATTIFAKWVANTYTVTYDGNKPSGATGTVSGLPSDQSWTYDSNATLGGTPTLMGWTFGGWYRDAGCTDKAGDAGATLNKPNYATSGTYKLYAKWTAKTTAVTLNMQSGSDGTSSVTAVYDSTMPSATMPKRTGFTFAGYFTGENGTGTKYYNGDGSSAKKWDITDEKKTLYAYWIECYAVVFNGNGNDGGSAPVNNPDYIAVGGSATMPTMAYTKTGYHVVSNEEWTDGTHIYQVGEIVPFKLSSGESINIYPKWVANTYAVSYDGNKPAGATANVTGVPSDDTWTYDSNATLGSAPSLTGWTFQGWYKDAECTEPAGAAGATLTKPNYATSGTVNLHAKWTANTYTVSYDANKPAGATAKVTGVPSDDTWTYDSNATLGSAPSLTGWTFGGWYKDEACTEPAGAAGATLTKPNYATSDSYPLFAKWQANNYAITLNDNGGTGGLTAPVGNSGKATYDSAMPSLGTPATLPTRTGYVFVGYYDTSSSTEGNQYYTSAGASSRRWNKTTATELFARWTPSTYSITLSAADADNVYSNRPTSNATYGSKMPSIATLPTRNGYNFVGYFTAGGVKYYKDDGSSAKEWDIASPTTLYAHWEAITYSIDYTLDGGTASNPTTYTIESSPITLTNPTRAGYSFAGWTETGLDAATMTVTIPTGSTGNRTYTATWTANTYTITFNTQSGSGGTDQVDAKFGSKMPAITTPTRTNHTFLGYYSNTYGRGTCYYDGSGASVTNWNIADNTTLYAAWAANTGYYILGTKVSSDGIVYSDSWALDGAIHADAEPIDDNTASWTTMSVFFNSDYAGIAADDQGFKIVEVTNGTIKSDGTITGITYYGPNKGDTKWFAGGSGSNITCASTGAYSVYFKEASIADDTIYGNIYFTKKVSVTLDPNEGVAGTKTVVTVTTGTVLPDLTSDYMPTRANYLFVGFFSTSAASGGTQYIKMDGTNSGQKWGTEDGTIYARWIALDDLFKAADGNFYLSPNKEVWDAANTPNYWIYLSGGPSADAFVKMTQTTTGNRDAYQATIPAGYWTTLTFLRVNSSKVTISSKNDGDVWNYSSDLSRSYFGSAKSYRITSWGEGNPNPGSKVQEFVTGETVYFDPLSGTTDWVAGTNVFGAYLFGGSTNQWVSLSRVDSSSTYYSLTVPSGNWMGIIFASFASGYDVTAHSISDNFTACIQQTTDLYRINLDSTFKCFRFTTAPAGDWRQLTDRVDGWYLNGKSLVSTTTLYPVGWHLDTVDKNGDPYPTGHYAIAGIVGGGNLAVWATVNLAANDIFKLVSVSSHIPTWKGFSDANFVVPSFFEADAEGNIKAKADCTVYICVNGQGSIWINVTGFSSIATRSGYRGESGDANVTGTIAVTVTVDASTGHISGVNSASTTLANYDFKYFSLSSALVQSSPAGATVSYSSGYLPALYAIYTKQCFTINVHSYCFENAESTSGVDTNEPISLVYYANESGEFDAFTGVVPFGVAAYEQWHLYLQDNSANLYSSTTCSAGSLVTDPYEAGFAVGNVYTLYARLNKTAESTYYFKDNIDANQLPIVDHSATFHGSIYVTAWYEYATGQYIHAGGQERANAVRLVHIYDNYYYCVLPDCASATFSNGKPATGVQKSMDIVLAGADSDTTAKGANDMVIVWKSTDELDATGGRKFSWGVYPGQYKYWLKIGSNAALEMGEGNNGTGGNKAVYEQPILVSAGDTFSISYGITYNTGSELNYFHLAGSDSIEAVGDDVRLRFLLAGAYTFYVSYDTADTVYVAMVPLKGEGYYLASGVYEGVDQDENDCYSFTYADAVKMHTISGGTNLAQYYSYQITAADITARKNTIKPKGYIGGVEQSFDSLSIRPGTTGVSAYTLELGYYLITKATNYNIFVYEFEGQLCAQISEAGGASEFFKLNSIDGSEANVKDQNTSFVLAIEFTADNSKAMDAYLDVTLASTTSAYKFAATMVAKSALSSTDPYAYMRNYAYTSNPSAFTAAGSSNASFKIGTTTIAANSSNVFVAMLIIDYASVSGGAPLETLISSVRIGISQQA